MGSLNMDDALADFGEEVVISGISGKFPESNSVAELRDNLMNKKDLITSNYTRWKTEHPDIPREGGTMPDLSKFDAIFFGVHYKQAHTMDPMCRMLLERAFEAIIDAGINPKELRGTNTGVVIGASMSEAEKTWCHDKLQANGFGITGCCKAMFANRISYFFNLHGPSYSMDTACSSSLTALDQAYRLIRTGVCDQVIVGGSNITMNPYIALQFFRLGVLSLDCRCKSFDERANGYARSEAISVILLQKAKVAKRIYATVVHTKSNCDGYKEQGITFPASEIQKMLLEDFYKECKLSPTILSYLEAHGTGTSVGDPEELNAINDVFCKGRTTPLPIGSVKSNMGHTEPASGLCSVAKVIIAMETGVIPPNINFKSPIKGLKCFEEGKVQVVTEPLPWNGGYIGINSFGFGGANTHVLLKSYTKEKKNNGAPTDGLSRLIAVSGRTQEAVETLLGYVESIPIDVEYTRLLHDVYAEEITGHTFRGYTIVNPKPDEKPIREINEYSGMKKPIWFVFSGMGSQWPGMGESLMKLEVFAAAIRKCDAALKPHGVDIIDIITNKDKKIFDNILNSFVGIAAIQIGLVDLLRSVGIVPDNIIGHSVGELGCAYADGCFTAEQMILSAYSRGLASIETEMIRGSMAAVGLGYKDIRHLCPPDIEVACHNGPDSSTISGPADSMKAFVAELQAKKIFAKEVNCSNIAYHSKYIAKAGPKLLEYLKKVIPDPKPRSSKWLSTSVPRSQWSNPEAQLSSAEYHTNNLLNSVLFAETATMIPEDAITIEIAPHGLLQAILKRSLSPNVTNVPLTKNGHKNNTLFFLQALGKLYNEGVQLQLANIYPAVSFPVSRGTPMISPFIKWQHNEDYYVPYNMQPKKIASAERSIEVSVGYSDYEYMKHHVIDGRNLFPAMGYLHLVWETLTQMNGQILDEVSVVFEDLKFERATTLASDTFIVMIVTIQRGSGKFEISEGSTTVVSGKIRITSKPSQEMIPEQFLEEIECEEVMTTADIYKELKLCGYEYSGPFRGIKSASLDGRRAHVTWMKNWSAFMDAMLQVVLLAQDSRSLYVPTAIKKIVIDTKTHIERIQQLPEENPDLLVSVYPQHKIIKSGGIEIRGLQCHAIQRRRIMAVPVLEEYKFVAHCDKAQITLEEMIVLTTQVALDSQQTTVPKIIELVDNDNIPAEEILAPIFTKVLADLPMTCPAISFISTSERYKEMELPDSTMRIEANKPPEDGNIIIAAAYNILSRKNQDLLGQLKRATIKQGFILTREAIVNNDTYAYINNCNLDIVLEKTFKNETLLLLKKQSKPPERTEVVYVNNNEFNWLNRVKEILVENEKANENNEAMRLVIVGEKDLNNGALGMVKCLRREPNGEIVKLILIQDENAPKFSLNDPFYSKQLNIDIGINVLRPGKVWGSYRHLPLPSPEPVPIPHAYANVKVRGDLSTIKWTQGTIEPDVKNPNLVKVVYASLNFRDVMLATGKLMPETITKDREQRDCLIGFEFSGIDTRGRRIMGFTQCRAISNIVIPHKYTQWVIPDEWSLEDAATIPSAYFTVFYALFHFGKMRKGEKVLIHAGSGAVGQAAINVALAEGCEVFTTVGTPEKRKFIRETFPSIDDNHIGNSRDTSFEHMVLQQTNGEGVDIVLNSLAEDKLQASLRCLRYRGRFLEIGKFDLAANNQLGMDIFLKEIAFHGVMLDAMIQGVQPHIQEEIFHFINECIRTKTIKPLVRKCFEKDEIEAAFRYMAAGKHIGKILIKVGNENEPLNTPILAYPRFNAMPNKSYVIIGGLGGLGLELSNWLVLRGAKNLVIVSRNGLKDGYQRKRTETWKAIGVKILIISGVDASKAEDCEFILKTAEKQAPVDGVFNLAAILNDALCTNQTEKSFEDIIRPKAGITKQLDEISRKVCPNLRHFVVFSSLSCGRGSPGQTNYGMGNAVMERICERRAEEGLPALAIEWGAVGEVGLAAKMLEDKKQLVVGGTLPQRISSCLEVLDQFLTQNRPIVASMVVAEKRRSAKDASNVLEAVMNIMSLKDLKGVSHSSSLADLGMDSMMAVEIKQTLERDFDVFLTPQDMRVLNVAKLIQMSEKSTKKQAKRTKEATNETDNLTGVKVLIQRLDPTVLKKNYCVELPVKFAKKKNEVFLVPGIGGSANIFDSLIPNLKVPATCLQLGVDDSGLSIEQMAERLLPYIIERCKNRRDFVLVGYSYGTCICIELARKLESLGFVGHLIMIDGSPDYMKLLNTQIYSSEDNEYENKFLLNILINYTHITKEIEEVLPTCTTWKEKIQKLMKYAPQEIQNMYSLDEHIAMCTFLYTRLRALDKYNTDSLPPIRSPITLLKTTIAPLKMSDDAYNLRKLTHGRVGVYTLEGNHFTILNNKLVAAAINGDPIEDEETFVNSLPENEEL